MMHYENGLVFMFNAMGLFSYWDEEYKTWRTVYSGGDRFEKIDKSKASDELFDLFKENQAKYNKTMGVSGLSSQLCQGYTVDHPVSNKNLHLEAVIISLNDEHKWTREQIADWLDTLEDQPTWKLIND